jgi:hypothetical protein
MQRSYHKRGVIDVQCSAAITSEASLMCNAAQLRKLYMLSAALQFDMNLAVLVLQYDMKLAIFALNPV